MKVLIIRFMLIPLGLIDAPESPSATSIEPDRQAPSESRPVDPKRLDFIKYLVETGQIHD